MIKLTFENKTYNLKYYFEVLEIILKFEYSYKIYKKKSKNDIIYHLEIYKNNKKIHWYSCFELEFFYNTFDFLICNFINKYLNDIYMFNDFFLFDDFTGEFIENETNKDYCMLNKIIFDNKAILLFKNSVYNLIPLDYYYLTTNKNNKFKAKFLMKIADDFIFLYYGIRNKKRMLFLSQKDINDLYKSIEYINNKIIYDLDLFLIFKYNLSYNLVKNPLRLIDIKNKILCDLEIKKIFI